MSLAIRGGFSPLTGSAWSVQSGAGLVPVAPMTTAQPERQGPPTATDTLENEAVQAVLAEP